MCYKIRSGQKAEGRMEELVKKMREKRSREGDEIDSITAGVDLKHTHTGTHSRKVYDLQGQLNQSWALKAISLHGAQIGNVQTRWRNTHVQKHIHFPPDSGLK